MLDIKFVRENIDIVRENLQKRGDNFDLDYFLEVDRLRRKYQKKIDELKAYQNSLDKEIKIMVREKRDVKDKLDEAKRLKEEISVVNEELKKINREFEKLLINLPNIVHPSLPVGDASANKVIREGGELRKFGFKPCSHLELGEYLDIFDFPRAAKISGSNFVIFKKQGARLVRALINFMLDIHTQKHGYTEIFTPFLVNSNSMLGTGQLPRLDEDMYKLKLDEYYLIPTAEVSITNIHRNEIIEDEKLPLYYVGYSACFRREAGSYGKETKGLVRLHQFDKVELVKFVKPDTSYQELEMLVNDAVEIIELLKLPYRIVLLATGDISFAAAKCYDIEIYAPGIDCWLEVSSCSNFEDFQARRAGIRYLEKSTGKKKFVHTLNGSGVALPRLIISLIENYQQEDSSISIPEVLVPYMGGITKIAK